MIGQKYKIFYADKQIFSILKCSKGHHSMVTNNNVLTFKFGKWSSIQNMLIPW